MNGYVLLRKWKGKIVYKLTVFNIYKLYVVY